MVATAPCMALLYHTFGQLKGLMVLDQPNDMARQALSIETVLMLSIVVLTWTRYELTKRACRSMYY